jgi:hypothetical protein
MTGRMTTATGKMTRVEVRRGVVVLEAQAIMVGAAEVDHSGMAASTIAQLPQMARAGVDVHHPLRTPVVANQRFWLKKTVCCWVRCGLSTMLYLSAVS